MFRLRTKTYKLKNAGQEEGALSVTRLNGATDYVRRVIFLADQDLVIATNYDKVVRVYKIDTTGEPWAVFERHADYVNDVVQLSNDVVASVGGDRCLYTWCASSAELVGKFEHSACLRCVAKLGESKIIVGDWKGNLTVLTHESASSIQVHRRLLSSHSNRVNDISVHGDVFVSCSEDNTAKVWDTNSLALRAVLPHDNWVRSAALNDRSIVTTCDNPGIYVFHNANKYKLQFNLALSKSSVGKVAFLNDDVVAFPAGYYLCFVSLADKLVLSCVRMEEKVASSTVLSDGRIAVGGNDGYCAIIKPPMSVQGAVNDCVASISAFRQPPLRTAWLAVQHRRISLAYACKTAITSENCAASMEEWFVAHDILIQAVKRKEIPATRHFDDSVAHWHSVLYQHCAKLAIGEKCIDFVKSRFKEAEDVGVIAKGQIESLINTIGIRRDMDRDNRFLVHATYQLFLRQAEMDVRLREVLHYKRVQQVTALVNAVIGCIPIGGAIAVNVIGGGASILNDMQVCGLVESVLGIGKDVSGGFGSDHLLDRFLHKTNAVMNVDEWKKVPTAKRKVVEDAANNLGLTIDELRQKLLIVTDMQSDEDGVPSEQAVIDEVNENTNIQHVVPVEDIYEGIAFQTVPVERASVGGAGPSTQGEDAAATTADEDETELKRWEEEGVSKDVVVPLKRVELAACFAAFLLGYESDNDGSFSKLKETTQEVLKKKRIHGASFAESSEEVKEELLDVLMTALAKVTDEDAMKITKMRVKKFIRLASQ